MGLGRATLIPGSNPGLSLQAKKMPYLLYYCPLPLKQLGESQMLFLPLGVGSEGIRGGGTIPRGACGRSLCRSLLQEVTQETGT